MIIFIINIIIVVVVFNHGEASLLVWNRVFSKELRFSDPFFLSLHHSLVSSTFLRKCADPSRADFWMVSNESEVTLQPWSEMM